MHKTLRRLPSLDFLRGFEAAGRRLSFTRAAEELFLTQSALSRQVKALEDALGVAAVRAQASRARADAGRRRVPPRRSPTQLRRLARRRRAVRARARDAGPHGVDDGVVRVAVADPAPRARFARAHPDVEVYVSADDRIVDLARGDVDVAVRYLGRRERFRRRGARCSASACCRS